jgi:hypothetical protein
MPVVYCPGAEAEFVVGKSLAEFRWHPSSDFDSDEQASYLGQSQVMRFLQSLIGADFRPTQVQLVSRPRHTTVDAMERFFGCKVSGISTANVISFPATILHQQLRTANK